MIDSLISQIKKAESLSLDTEQRIRQLWKMDSARFLDAVTEEKLAPEDQVLKALGHCFGIPCVLDFAPGAVPACDASFRRFLKRMCMVPLPGENSDSVLIALNDPLQLPAADDLANRMGMEYCPVLAPKNKILSAINILFDASEQSTRKLVADMQGQEFTIIEDAEQTADLLEDAGDAPVIRLVNHMISQAVKAGSSDIHIEPFQDSLRVRYRIDGILYDMLTPPKAVQAALVSRIKVMARMNIAERRVPQDGRAQVRMGDQEIDLRISTVPTAHGERLVMRLLNKTGYLLRLSQFGLSKENHELIDKIIHQNNGIVLVTGPTGSGKTTTLYAALSRINSPDKNIITIEDPVEYNLGGIGQIQVNPKTGVTFAKGLRAIVRQDPDVILVGEVRDLETARIAIQSALTGHLVFSTLHTNDAPGAVTRLADLGVEPYLIASSVNAVIAQRLVRLLCPACKEAFEIEPSHVQSLNGYGKNYIGSRAYRPVGCSECFETGYSGRQPIFEIMMLTDSLKNMILHTSDANQIRSAALENGMITLYEDGMNKVLQGLTSIREVFRVSQV